MSTFYEWLGQQAERQDDVGAFARSALRDRVFPREVNKLGLLLSRYDGLPERRELVKIAHREWRRAKRMRRAA